MLTDALFWASALWVHLATTEEIQSHHLRTPGNELLTMALWGQLFSDPPLPQLKDMAIPTKLDNSIPNTHQ